MKLRVRGRLESKLLRAGVVVPSTSTASLVDVCVGIFSCILCLHLPLVRSSSETETRPHSLPRCMWSCKSKSKSASSLTRGGARH